MACQSSCGQTRKGLGIKANPKFIGIFVDIKSSTPKKLNIWINVRAHTNMCTYE